MRAKEEVSYLLNGLDSFRTIIITDDLINEVKQTIDGYEYNENEVEYMIIISSSNLFFNHELEYFINRFSRYFETKICLEIFIKINNILIIKYNDLLNDFRRLSVLNSFYKSAIGYNYFEDTFETFDYVKTICGKEVTTKKLDLKKTTKKHVTADKEFLRLLVNKYGVLDGKTILNPEEMLIELIKNNK